MLSEYRVHLANWMGSSIVVFILPDDPGGHSAQRILGETRPLDRTSHALFLTVRPAGRGRSCRCYCYCIATSSDYNCDNTEPVVGGCPVPGPRAARSRCCDRSVTGRHAAQAPSPEKAPPPPQSQPTRSLSAGCFKSFPEVGVQLFAVCRVRVLAAPPETSAVRT